MLVNSIVQVAACGVSRDSVMTAPFPVTRLKPNDAGASKASVAVLCVMKGAIQKGHIYDIGDFVSKWLPKNHEHRYRRKM